MRIKNMRIVSSANFKRELSRYLRETTAEDSPIFVTINGSGSHVLMHIDQYNHLLECENYIEEHGIKLHEEEKVKEEKKQEKPVQHPRYIREERFMNEDDPDWPFN
jgi:PHD/YefM family antitoxin component YafN of YafNO toxin-antitoxin module